MATNTCQGAANTRYVMIWRHADQLTLHAQQACDRQTDGRTDSYNNSVCADEVKAATDNLNDQLKVIPFALTDHNAL